MNNTNTVNITGPMSSPAEMLEYGKAEVKDRIDRHKFKVKDPGSALTHFIAAIAATIGAFPLIHKAAAGPNSGHIGAFVVFILSMIALYSASTNYHTFNRSEKANKVLRKLDHGMIFILIAGSYTPVCIMSLPESTGMPLLITVWSAAIIGIIFKICWITCPKWVSSMMYIGMGWLVVGAFSSILENLSRGAFIWLLTGGIIYTVGGIIYALKLPILKRFNWKYFGNHELFHCFVMAGSLCHYIMVYTYLA